LKKAFKADVQLVPSSGGVFEVVADGSLVFSKKSLGRFPEEGEIVTLIRAADRTRTGG
jgi:selenoprotein W-related protein